MSLPITLSEYDSFPLQKIRGGGRSSNLNRRSFPVIIVVLHLLINEVSNLHTFLGITVFEPGS